MVDLSGRVIAQSGYQGRGSDPAWSPLLDAAPANLGRIGAGQLPVLTRATSGAYRLNCALLADRSATISPAPDR